MRELLLPPGHSQWWLLSPGIMIYYDHICILKKDFEDVIERAPSSSYHARIAKHLEIVNKDQFTELKIIESIPETTQICSPKRAIKVRDELIRSALDPNDPTLTSQDVFKILFSSFSTWVHFNKRKLLYLNPGEPYHNYLGTEKIPQWEKRIELLKQCCLPNTNKFQEELLQNDPITQGSLLRLITTVLTYMDLTHAGHHIYDPLLQSYLPAIELLEGQTIANKICNQGGDVNKLFEVFHSTMKKYNECLPININIKDLWKESKKHAQIRKNLARLDDTLNRITDDDLKYSLQEVQKQIKSVVQSLETSISIVDHGFWIAGIVCSIISTFLPPSLLSKLSNELSNLQSISKGIGLFAGRYALIADKIIIAQDDDKMRFNNHTKFNKKLFDEHYKPFSSSI